MSEVNKKYNRKRIINIDFIIIKILKEIDNSNYKFTLKISSKLLILYNSWWKSYYELINRRGVKSPAK